MREDVDICDFTAGELSPKLKGRTDYARYFDGLASQLNMVSMPQGGATRRPGFAVVARSTYPIVIPPPLAAPTIQALGYGGAVPSGDWIAVDWTSRRFYCPTAFFAGLVEYDLDTGAQIATKTIGALGIAGIGLSGAVVAADGYLYFNNGSYLYKAASGLTIVNSFGDGGYANPVTEIPSPTPYGVYVAQHADADYLIISNSGSSIGYVFNLTSWNFAGVASNFCSQGWSFGAAGPASGGRGTAFFIDYTFPGFPTVANFYAMTIAPGAGAYDPATWPIVNPKISIVLVAAIAPTDIDATWTHIRPSAIMYDFAFGDVIVAFFTPDLISGGYLVKLSASTGAIIWKTPLAESPPQGGASGQATRISYGVVAIKGQSGAVYVFNTQTGASVGVPITGLDMNGDIASDDATGDILVWGGYTEGSSNVVPVGGTPSTYAGLWGRLDLAGNAGVGFFRPPGPLLQSRLRRFIFSTVQAYMLEFTKGFVLVYADDAVAENGGGPIEIATPWSFADLPLLEFTQSADTLYIYHPLYAPRTLTRDASDNWTLAVIAWRDGPYLDVNGTTTTLSPSGVNGNITITASSAVGINVTPTSKGLGFLATDLGRMIRIRLFSLWAWCVITAVTDSLHVKATVQPWIQNGGAYGAIDGQAWAPNTLYPTGAVVLINDSGTNRYYIAITGGISGAANGPSGTGSNLLDGTVTWSLAGPFDAIAWRQYTVYAPGDIIYSTPPSGSGLFYQCTTGGNTGGSSVPPVGTGTNIAAADQNCLWESIGTFVFPTTTTFWQLGKWYGPDGVSTSNWPQIPLFYQGRLMSLSTNAQPGAVEGSYSNDFTNMAPTRADGTVTAANAISEVIASDEVDDVRWAVGAGSSVAQQLGIGTSGGEWVMQPATNAQALGPGNVQVYQETKFGGALGVQPLRIGKSILFADVAGRVLYDWIWQWAINGFMGIDRTVDAEHMTRCDPPTLQGIVAMAYQQKPYKIIWMAKGDGSLVAMTYMPDEKIIAWHRHQLGGTYNGGPPLIESIDSIPSPDTTYDELWAVVRRTNPDGSLLRTVEVMTRFFDALPQDQAVFMDGAFTSTLSGNEGTENFLTYAASAGTGVNFHCSAAVFSIGQTSAILRVNDGIAVMRGFVDANNITCDWIIPAKRFEPLGTVAWSFNFPETTFTGLDLFAGQTVQILGDGADYGTQVVADDGSITIAPGASYVVAGLEMPWELVTMPFAPSRAAPVPAVGKTKKFDKLYLRFYESLGCEFGQLYTDSMTGKVIRKTEKLLTQSSSSSLGWAPQYVSSIRRLAPPSGFDQEGQVLVTGCGPFPVTVLSIGVSADVGSS